jgi:glycosyltransferase involved in cell wall biosynthesis
MKGQMRRVLIIDLSKRFGGADVRVAQIASGLSAKFETAVAVIEGSQTHERLKKGGIRVLPLAGGRKDPRLAAYLYRIMREWGPAVVDAHNAQSMLWGLPAARACRVPIRVATFHSVFAESERRPLGRLLYGALDFLVRQCANRAVSVSETVTAHLLRVGFDPGQVFTIPNGIPVSEPRRLCTEPTRPLRIAVVGRLVPVKGHSVLLEALASLPADVGDVECLIVGDGPEKDRLEFEARRFGVSSKTQFLGYRTDAVEIVANSDLLCLPSLTEALPFAALEAAARGVPIVASRVGGLAIHFTDRKTAMLVPPGDPRALAAALAACARDRREAHAMGERGRLMVADRFSIARTLSETALAYGSDATSDNRVDNHDPSRRVARCA